MNIGFCLRSISEQMLPHYQFLGSGVAESSNCSPGFGVPSPSPSNCFRNGHLTQTKLIRVTPKALLAQLQRDNLVFLAAVVWSSGCSASPRGESAWK